MYTDQNELNRPLHIMAVGDINLGDRPLCLQRGVNHIVKKYGPNFPFEYVKPVLYKADICFANLETGFSKTNKLNPRSKCFRAQPIAVAGLKYAGFNVVGLANNHISEHGKEHVDQTISLLNEQNIKYAGIGKDNIEARKPSYITINNTKIAFLAYSLIPTPGNQSLYAIGYIQDVINDIKRVRLNSDLVIVSMHWGAEYMERPSPYQRRLAHKVIDAGAKMIIGHHPHVIQGIEKYKEGIIVYSLGNFVFDQNFVDITRLGAIFSCRLVKSTIVDHEMIPVYINQYFQPEIVRGDQKNIIQKKINRLSEEILKINTKYYSRELMKYGYEFKYRQKWIHSKMRKYILINLHKISFAMVLIILQSKFFKILRGLKIYKQEFNFSIDHENIA